jgi:septal ring factor EnvC (AmiA/AmiB activator)
VFDLIRNYFQPSCDRRAHDALLHFLADIKEKQHAMSQSIEEGFASLKASSDQLKRSLAEIAAKLNSTELTEEQSTIVAELAALAQQADDAAPPVTPA